MVFLVFEFAKAKYEARFQKKKINKLINSMQHF